MTNNVVFKEARKVIEITLPSFEGSRVEMWDGILFGQMKEIGKCSDDFARGILVLRNIIKDWNFTDVNGNKLEVSDKTLNQFPLKDLTVLMTRANKILEDISKKKEESSKKQ